MIGASSSGQSGSTTRERRRTGQPVMDGVGHDRQILVIGGGLTAAASAGFLQQAGLDPVLAVPDPDVSGAESSLVAIWQPGLELLGRVGLRRPIERVGTRLTRLETVTGEATVATGSTDRSGLVAIRRGDLRDVLERQMFSRIRQAKAPVGRVRSTGKAVDVSFRSGVEEQFDTVITSSLSFVAEQNSMPSGRSVHVWEFEWPKPVPEPSHTIEVWEGDRAAFLTPHPEGATVQLIATGGAAGTPGVRLADLQTQFGAAFADVADPFPALDQYDLTYRQPVRAAPASLSVGGVTLVGAAARASVPGDCLSAALGIEDAWVAADTLAYGPHEVAEAHSLYETRRRRRERDLESTLAAGPDDDRVSTPLSPHLQRLSLARTLAFGHVIDDALPEVAREIPDRL